MRPPALGNLATVDVVSHAPADAARERSDVTAVPAASIVVLAMAAMVVADALLEKFGNDTVSELLERLEVYGHKVAEY